MKPVRMEEIAAAAGVHRTTVSMALRNHPKLPQATRERIQAVARELGYRPNPLVSALMHYRAGRRTPQAHGEMLYLTNEVKEPLWRKPLSYRKIFAGAQARAAELGYRLEPLWLREPGLTPRGLARLLRARNIHAAIVAPRSSSLHSIREVEWGGLSVVTIGYALESPSLHRVAHDYFHSAVTVARRGPALGFRRIGLVLSPENNERVEHRWVGGWMAMQLEPGGSALLPPLLCPSGDKEALRRYLREHRPDALCALPSLRLETLRPWPRESPHPAFINLGCYDTAPGQLGIYQNHERIGAVAVEQVVSSLLRSERGIPTQAIDTLVRGVWMEPTQMPRPGGRPPSSPSA